MGISQSGSSESWQVDEVTAREDTATSSGGEADKLADEASEALQDKDSSTALLLPEAERSKALARVMAFLSSRESSEVDTVSEVIALMPAGPDKALWLSLKLLRLGVTASSRDVFGCGTGGKAFQKAKDWYQVLDQPLARLWNSIKFG
jgi:hypothetical protein